MKILAALAFALCLLAPADDDHMERASYSNLMRCHCRSMKRIQYGRRGLASMVR